MNIEIPKLIYGTSAIGNLFVALEEQLKFKIIKECIETADGIAMFDTAGKYGAGLALETIGKGLKKLGVDHNKVLVSNKLAWLRSPLLGTEPTFEPGVWKNLKHDAIQKISYDGIIECYEQGNELLGDYPTQLASVHDPDEFLDAAQNEEEYQNNYQKILEAYQALNDLKSAGKVKGIGIGAKNWKIIKKISKDIHLDWVMIANSLTIFHHPPELLQFITDLKESGVHVINSAIFHSGFLVGGNFMDYKLADQNNPINNDLFKWRNDFFALCKEFNINPAHACVQFALKIPGVNSIALSTTDPNRVATNKKMILESLPFEFWSALFDKGLITYNFSQITPMV
jgi:D-threo-aldose 1-dehydrogenase